MNVQIEPRHMPAKPAASFVARNHRLLIGGAWTEAQWGKTFDVFDPATAKAVPRVAAGEPANVDHAVKAALRTLRTDPWACMTAAARHCD